MKYFNGLRKKSYFEGWYFKHTSKSLNISIIPSISINKNNDKVCYIQVITPFNTTLFTFSINMFSANKDKLYIKIDNNVFSKNGMTLDLANDDFKIKAKIKYNNLINIKGDIMGPFKHVPFMECSHRVISMKHSIEGYIQINDEMFDLNKGIGYIESDYGHSFPIHYKWIQANDFPVDLSIFFSSAKIPYHLLTFNGLICSVIFNKQEYRFSTYNFSKIIKNDNNEVIIKKGKYVLYIKYQQNHILHLKAPTNGTMSREILECIDGTCQVQLSYKNKIIFNTIGKNCGIEIS